MYSIRFNSERGKPSRNFGLMPRDMHGSWVIVAPKPLPKVRTHADLDCAYHKRGNCIVVNNNDGLYGPGGKGGGVSDLDLKACDSMNCNDQALHHMCQTAAEKLLAFDPGLGHFCQDCLTQMEPR